MRIKIKNKLDSATIKECTAELPVHKQVSLDCAGGTYGPQVDARLAEVVLRYGPALFYPVRAGAIAVCMSDSNLKAQPEFEETDSAEALVRDLASTPFDLVWLGALRERARRLL